MPALTATAHIWLDEHGRAWIDETNVKVVEVVTDHLAQGWSADTIHEQYPHLSKAQIYAALGYYYDHEEDFARSMDEDARRVLTQKAATGNSLVQQRLGKLRTAR